MKILVAGGLSPEFEEGNAEEVCARALGRGIASRGYVLLNGAFNTFDRLVAEAANEVIQRASGGDATAAIHTYLTPGWKPAHKLGKLQKLNVSSWDPGQPEWDLPQPLLECDALVVMGGGPRTHRVVHLSRLAAKPILPIAAFGGAADEAFRTEMARFNEVYRDRVAKDEYAAILNTAIEALEQPASFERLATGVVSLVSKVVLGNEVFVIMCFREESDDTFNTIRRVCESYGLKANRTDKDGTTDRIYNRIAKGIRCAAFVVADVTFESVNVYYELGFSDALEKEMIVVAKEGTKLPFDTNDIPTTFFRNQTRLEEALRHRIEYVTRRQAQPPS